MQGVEKTKGISEGFKDVDIKQGIVTGYFAHFGSKDSDGDIIVQGAFAKTILAHGPSSKNPRVKHLLDHNKQNAVAKILLLKEDDFGLYYESKAGRHAAGRDFLLMVEDGIITEHSHGYITLMEEQKSDANYIYENVLTEGSSLQFWGANPNTPVTGVKAFESIIVAYENLTKALRNGQYTDETFVELHKKHDALTKQIEEMRPKPNQESSIYESIIKYL